MIVTLLQFVEIFSSSKLAKNFRKYVYYKEWAATSESVFVMCFCIKVGKIWGHTCVVCDQPKNTSMHTRHTHV